MNRRFVRSLQGSTLGEACVGLPGAVATSDAQIGGSGKWEDVRNAAVAVTALTQRQEGLWSLPTSQFDLSLLFAPSGSLTERVRRREGFGFPSMGVTYVALEGLRRCGAPMRESVARVLTGLPDFQQPDGAYGSLRPIANSPPQIIPSARHTGCGLLIALGFGPAPEAHAPPEKTARWLVARRNRLQDGGWAYDIKQNRSLGPTTTAVCLAALCQFSSLHGLLDGTFKRALSFAISSGLAALEQASEHGLWDTGPEGGPRATQVGDAGLVHWFLGHAESYGLSRHSENAGEILARLREQYYSLALPIGFPELPGSTQVGVEATISGLWGLLNTPRATQAIEDDRLEVMLKFVQSALREADCPHVLRTHDWAVLCHLGSQVCGPFGQLSALRLQRTVLAVERATSSGRLSWAEINRLPPLSRVPIAFALTKGAPDQLLQKGLDTWFQRLTEWRRGIMLTLLAVPVTVVAEPWCRDLIKKLAMWIVEVYTRFQIPFAQGG